MCSLCITYEFFFLTHFLIGGILPLAFAVVDGENDESWEWFFNQFKSAFGVRDQMVFVSDRHKSIEKTCISIFPEATHCICMFHLLNNLKGTFKKNTKAITKYFLRAAKSYTVKEFDMNMDALKNVHKGIPRYLQVAGFEKWSRVYCPQNRFVAMTSNIAESINSVHNTAKDLPIAALVDHLFESLQGLFFKNHILALNTRTTLMRRYEKILQENYRMASTMQVLSCYITSHLTVNICSIFKVFVLL